MFPDDIRSPNDLADKLLPLVCQVMSITDVTEGDQKQPFAVRFRGTLISDSELAFEKLDPAFKQAGTTLLFREENDGHEILGMPGVIQPQASNPLVNVILFLLTLASMLMAGAMYGMEAPADTSILGILRAALQNLPNGITFAASLLGILMAHEFGHYFAARFHRIAVSLPYFLPFPLSLFGTLGAFIRLKEPPKNRRVLLDIGLSGPIAGLIVAIPVLLVGLYLSDLGRLPLNAMAAQGSVLEGNSLLYLALKYIVTGEFLPKPLLFHRFAHALRGHRCVITPARVGWLGWIARHDAQPHPCRPTRWWSCNLCLTGKSDQKTLALHHRVLVTAGNSMAGVVHLGRVSFPDGAHLCPAAG